MGVLIAFEGGRCVLAVRRGLCGSGMGGGRWEVE